MIGIDFIEEIKPEDFKEFFGYTDKDNIKIDIFPDDALPVLDILVQEDKSFNVGFFSDFILANFNKQNNIIKQNKEISEQLKNISNGSGIQIAELEWQVFMLNKFGEKYAENLKTYYKKSKQSQDIIDKEIIANELIECTKKFKRSQIEEIINEAETEHKATQNSF